MTLKPIKDGECEIYPLDYFYNQAKHGVITEDDGEGYFSDGAGLLPGVSVFSCVAPSWSTHVAWFQK